MPNYTEDALSKPTGLLLSAEGLEKSGKTWSVLATAPQPVLYVNCDRDNRRIVNKLRASGRRILLSGQYLFTPDVDQNILREKNDALLGKNAAQALSLWKPIKRDLVDGFSDPAIKTVFFDSGSAAYAMMRIARFGKLIEIPQVLYSKTNYEWRAILMQAQASGKVVIIAHRLAKEFVKNNDKSSETGKLTIEGYKGTNFEVDAIVRHERSQAGVYSAKVLAEGVARPDMLNVEYEGDTINYTEIVAKLTRTKVGAWQ